MFACNIKLLNISLDSRDDLTGLYNWNIAKGVIAKCSKTLCFNFCRNTTAEFVNGLRIDDVQIQKDLGVENQSDLKLTSQFEENLKILNVDIFLAKRCYALEHSLKCETRPLQINDYPGLTTIKETY